MKKILSILLIGVIIMSCLPSVFAVSDLEPDAPYADAVEVVTALGIMAPESNTSFNPKKAVTRAELVAYAVHLMNVGSASYENLFYDVPANHKYASEITYAYKSGMVHGDGMGHFYPDSPVSLSEAVKMLCYVTGHNRIAAQYDNPSIKYNMLARELELTDGLDLSMDDKLTRGEIAQLLYNVLFAPIVKSEYSNGYSDLYESKDDNVMSLYLGINCDEGRMTANRYFSITGEKESSSKQIEIEFEKYFVDGDINDSLLGYYVKAFYRESANNAKEVFCIIPSAIDNSVITIPAKDILKSENGKIEYSNGKKVKTENIPSDVYVIYNGEPVADWHMSDFIISNGYVKLLSNDGNSKVDMVIVENYVNDMLVGVSEDSEKLYFENSGVIAYDSFSTVNKLVIKDASTGASLDVSALKADTMVSLLVNKAGDRYEIYTNSYTVAGILNSVSNDSAVIGGTAYPFVSDIGLSSYLGKNVTVWVDYNGYLAIIDDKTNSNQLGYIIGFDLSNDAIDKKAMIKMLSSDSTTSVFYVSDNVVVDGKRTASVGDAVVTITAENLKNVLENAAISAGTKDGNVSQLIRYRVNASGEISEIDTAKYNADSENENSLQLSTMVTQASGERLYCRGNGVLYNMGTRRVACNIPSTAKVFLISNGPEYRVDSEELSVEKGNYFKADYYYVNGSAPTGVAFEAYNCNDVKTSEIIVLYMPDDSMIGAASTNIPSNYRTRAFAIKNMYRSLDDDENDVATLVTLDAGGKEILYQTSRKLSADYIFENFKIGDVVAIDLVNDKVTAIKQLFRYSDDASFLTPNMTEQDVVFFGELYSCDGSYMALNFASSGETPDTSSFYVGGSTTRLAIYDTSRRMLRMAKVGDFIGSKQTGTAGNKVMIYTNWSTPQLVVMFE